MESPALGEPECLCSLAEAAVSQCQGQHQSDVADNSALTVVITQTLIYRVGRDEGLPAPCISAT